MLHARLEVAQILNILEIRAVITEFSAGQDPEVFVAENFSCALEELEDDGDSLSIVISALRLWSEMTNSD